VRGIIQATKCRHLVAMLNIAENIAWTDSAYASFGRKPQVNQHQFHRLELFSKDKLIALLDEYPRKWLQAFTMGADPTASGDWRCVDIHPDSTGEQLWQAVERGRLWLNLTHIGRHDPRIGELIEQMYLHLGKHCPHLQSPSANYSTLLISSPGAQVYYHLDAEPNMLWHLSGQKRFWVYPAMDTRFVQQEMLEDIFAGEIDENLPFDPSFDDDAVSFLLQPGEVASWPHNAPHRIQNVDLNVSLATSYYTPTVYKRQYVQLANRFLLRGLGMQVRSMEEEGFVPAFKRVTYRAINKLRPFARRDRSASYVTDLQIDADNENGLRRLETSKHASFSNQGPTARLSDSEVAN